MRMRDNRGRATELPKLDVAHLSEDERAYLEVMLGLAETGDMFHGRFVEVHVARLIGADVPDVGISPWDLWVPDVPPITVEVKATRLGGTFSIATKASQVWVFVAYPDKRHHTFEYVVASNEAVRGLNQRRMSQTKVFAMFGPQVPADQLGRVVRDTARRR